MYLTDDEVTEFQVAFKENFGKEISREDARERFTKLVRLFEIIYKPITKKEYGKVQAMRKELRNNMNKNNN